MTITRLYFLHINTKSLLPKMDQLKVWVHSSNTDVLVITETWLRKSVLNTAVNLSGYNLFWQDRSSKGGGVTIFTKEHLQCSVVSKQFDLLVLSIKLSNNSLLTVAGCYSPPSAPVCTLPVPYLP
jgi:exonuclease III